MALIDKSVLIRVINNRGAGKDSVPMHRARSLGSIKLSCVLMSGLSRETFNRYTTGESALSFLIVGFA